MTGQCLLVGSHDALSLCARAMDDGCENDAERDDVRTIYSVAGRMAVASASSSFQIDSRISIPRWLHARFSGQVGEGGDDD